MPTGQLPGPTAATSRRGADRHRHPRYCWQATLGRSQPATCAARRCQHDRPDRQRFLVHRSMAAGPHDDCRGAAPDGFLLDNSTAYTFWAYADQASRFPLDSRALNGADLQGVVLDRTTSWAPALRELIGGSTRPPSTRSRSAARRPSTLADRACDPARRRDPQRRRWPASVLTRRCVMPTCCAVN